MIAITDVDGPVVEIEASGRITHDDYAGVLPRLEEIVDREGAMRCVLKLQEIERIEPRAVLDDARFDVRHATDFDRVALLADRRWHEWAMKAWGAVMPGAEIRCFHDDELADARAWVRG